MRNLKRALSLALASIMLLGMMVTGAGAASTSFTDFDQIVNQEAAEVTSGLGIFDGYTDGSFGPENVVTRAEMAVIICKLLNGSDVDPGNFTGISKFTDVPAWAEGYVNYCAASGIVVGVGEGKFNPSATVTTVEAATMLLKALGYFTEEDQLKADWKTVVTGRATSLGLYGDLVLKSDEGLTRDNVAELVFHTLFAQRVAYDDNRQLYVKNTNRDVVVTNGTFDPDNTFAMNTFGMWYVDGIVTANSYTDDGLSETVNNAPRTDVLFDERTDMGNGPVEHYAFEYTTGLDMIAHAARVYYSIERKAPVVYAIADRATRWEYISYNSNATRLAEAANQAQFRKNSISTIPQDDWKVNYSWDRDFGALKLSTDNVDLSGSATTDTPKTLLLVSNSSDFAVDYVIVLDQYLDTVRRVVDRNGETAYDLTTINGDRQNVALETLAEGDYVIVTDIGKSGEMLVLEKPEQVTASISKITGISDKDGTVKSITADGTDYVGSPVYDHKVTKRELDNVTDFEDITTLGETTLLLDTTLGKCIALAQPAAPEVYAYVEQYAEKHVDGFGTEYKLVAKVMLSDGTEGTYMVNTDAGTSKSNSFFGYKFPVGGGAAELDKLNAASAGKNYDVYSTAKFSMLDANNNAEGCGLGVFKATVRADGSIVLAKLAGGTNSLYNKDAEDANRAHLSGAKAVVGHSTLIATNNNVPGIQENRNVTSAMTTNGTNDNLYQTSKTVFFYVNGEWGNSNFPLSVGVRTGIDKLVAVKDGDTNDEGAIYKPKEFRQVFSENTNSNSANEVGRREVSAEMIYGVTIRNDNLYFYKEGNYRVDRVSGSRADEKCTITFELYDKDGGLVEQTYDNKGKYFEEGEIRGEVQDKKSGWYTIGADQLQKVIWEDSYNKSIVYEGNVIMKEFPNDASALLKDKVFVINAPVDHVDYEGNIYTKDERVGGITSGAVIVDLTGEELFHSAADIERAYVAGHQVNISYYYSVSGSDAYKVKAVFVTEYDPYAIDNTNSRYQNVYSRYNSQSGKLEVYDNGKESRFNVAASAQKAYESAGFTVTNVLPSIKTEMVNGRSVSYWGMTIARDGWGPYNVTNCPTSIQNMFMFYANSVDVLNAVFVNTNGKGNVFDDYVLSTNDQFRKQVTDNYTVTASYVNLWVYQAGGAATAATVVTVGQDTVVKPIPVLNSIESRDVTVFVDEIKATAVINSNVPDNKLPENKSVEPEFENGGDETGVGSDKTLKGRIRLVDKTRAAMSGDKFLAAMEYTLTFAFAAENNTTVNVTVKASVESDSDTLPFTGLKIPAGAIVNEKNQYIVTLVDIDEGPKAPEEEEGKVTSITVTGIPTEYDAAQTYDVKVTGTNLNGDKTVIGDWTVNGTTATLTITAEPMADCTFADKVVVTPTPASQEVKDGKITITYEVKVKEDTSSSDATVRAVTDDNGATWKLYAYYGDKATVTLSKEEIIAAINAERGTDESKAVDVSRADPTATTGNYVSGKWDDGMSFTISGSANESSTVPGKLYKLVFPNNVTKYVEASGTLTDMPKNTAYIISTKVTVAHNTADASLIKVDADGEATMPATLADATYVEALQLGSVVDGTDNKFSGATIYAIYNGKNAVLTQESNKGDGQGSYFVKGSKLGIQITSAALANQSVTITVNGVKKETSADKDGKIAEFETDAITEGKGGSGRVDISVAGTALYTVTLNGEVIAENVKVNEEVAIPSAKVPTGATFVYYDDAAHTVDTTKDPSVVSGWGNTYTYTVSANHKNTAVTDKNAVELATIYKITESGFGGTLGSLYEKYDTTTNTPDGAISADKGIVAEVGKSVDVYLVAKDKNAVLGLADGATGLKMSEIRPAGINQQGVWKITLEGNLTSSAVEVKAQLPAAADDTHFAEITLSKVIFGGESGTTTEEEVTCLPKNTDLDMKDVEIKWLDADAGSDGMAKTIGTGAAEDTFTIIKGDASTNGLKIKVVSDMATSGTSGSTAIGTIQITLKQGNITLTTKMTVKTAS